MDLVSFIWTFDRYKAGYSTIRPLIELEAILPFYNFYDAFSAVVWCKNRGIEKHKAFLNESISVLHKSVGYRTVGDL
jgi:hypothetical protein